MVAIGRNKEHLSLDALKGKLVAVHWNVRDYTFSIVEMVSKKTVGKVIGYADYITLENCYPLVSKSEQRKVRDGGHKTRHAFIVGNIVDLDIHAYSSVLYYNPKKLDSFVDKSIYMSGQTLYLDSMDRVAFAKVPSKNKPLVTYNRGCYNSVSITS